MGRKLGSKNLNVLQRYRAKAKLSQSQLSKLTGINVETLSRIENGKGKRGVSVLTIGKLVSGLNAAGLSLEPEDLAELMHQDEVSDRTRRRMKQQKRKQQDEVLQEDFSSEADSQQFSNTDIASNSLQLAA